MLVLRRGLMLTLMGTVLGVAGGLGAGRMMRGILYEIEPFDPTTFVLVPLLLCAIAVLACALPRRAAAVEPLTALKID